MLPDSIPQGLEDGRTRDGAPLGTGGIPRTPIFIRSTMLFEDLASVLDVIHIGTSGEACPVDETHPANGYTSRRLDGNGHAMLVDIDDVVHRATDGWWLMASTPRIPTLQQTLNQLLQSYRLVDGARIVVPYVTTGSHTPGHQHLYLLGSLTEQQLVTAHAALVWAGVEGWGNLFQVVKRGYSVLYFPGAKATRPGTGSGDQVVAR